MNETKASAELYISLVVPELKKLLNNIPAEKPDRILNSTDGSSKWRKGWFTGVLSYIDMLGFDFFNADEKLKQRIDDARKSWVTGEFKQKKLTEQDDIDQADQLIRDVLVYIEARK